MFFFFVVGKEEWKTDVGDLKGKEFLPVKQLRFGDTGTPLDDKKGKYTLGPLKCEGDGVFLMIFLFNSLFYTLSLKDKHIAGVITVT